MDSKVVILIIAYFLFLLALMYMPMGHSPGDCASASACRRSNTRMIEVTKDSCKCEIK